MQNPTPTLPLSSNSSRSFLYAYRIAALLFAGWITMLLLVPDPYATSDTLEKIRHAGLNGYLIHFTVYCLVSTFCLSSLRKRGTSVWWILTLLIAGHGCVTELLQIGVPGRTPELLDATANLFGIAVGTVIDFRLRQLWSYLASRVQSREERHSLENGMVAQ